MLDSGSWTNSNRKCTNWTFLDYLVFAWFIDHALRCLQRTYVRYNHLWLEKLTTKFLTPSSLFRNCGYWAWTRSFVKKLEHTITICTMVVCKFFMQGYCRYGDNCKFEHPRGGNAGKFSFIDILAVLYSSNIEIKENCCSHSDNKIIVCITCVIFYSRLCVCCTETVVWGRRRRRGWGFEV